MQSGNNQNNLTAASGSSRCIDTQESCGEGKKKDSRPFLATSHNKSISQGGVHGEHRPVVSSGHNPTQYVIFPHTDISTDGTCKRQVILKRSGEGGDKLIKSSNRVQADAVLYVRVSLPHPGYGGSGGGEMTLAVRLQLVRAFSYSRSVPR